MKGPSRARAAGLFALGLCLIAPRGAAAQVADPQRAITAQALYEQATAELDAGNYASACRKLEEVTRLVPEGLGAKITLGNCYEAMGKLASAWSQFALAEAQAARLGQAERAALAAQKAAALKPRLAMLTVEVPKEARAIGGLSVTRDGLPLGEAQWGTALPVDAGSHEIAAFAPGFSPWKTQIEVVADGAKVSVRVKPLVPDPKARNVAVGAPVGSLVMAAPPPDRSWQRPVGFATLAAGGAGLGAGAILGGLAIAKKNESNRDNHCDAMNLCDAVGLGLREQAVGLGNASTGLLFAGGILAVGGAVLVLTAPKEQPKKKMGLAASVMVLPGGAAVAGAW
ncbi:hypothetical protein [Polyangium aurulentum]|uniref:hypothetical protein n=1 Tax=Polyangium aurulentum TaxID=2567896 RepID=UPI0010ADB696|nr:hypothetical protein [Polyangium aurulentum]UQA56278.1 hypothetical protein E8A73_033920 [Polyangium aurulentum]